MERFSVDQTRMMNNVKYSRSSTRLWQPHLAMGYRLGHPGGYPQKAALRLKLVTEDLLRVRQAGDNQVPLVESQNFMYKTIHRTDIHSTRGITYTYSIYT